MKIRCSGLKMAPFRAWHVSDVVWNCDEIIKGGNYGVEGRMQFKKKGGTYDAYGALNDVCRCTISLRVKFCDRNGRGSSVAIEKFSLLQVHPSDGTRYSRTSLHSVQPRYLLCGTFSDRSVYADSRIQPLERTLRRLWTVAGSLSLILVLILSPLRLAKSYNHFLNFDWKLTCFTRK